MATFPRVTKFSKEKRFAYLIVLKVEGTMLVHPSSGEDPV